MSNAATRRKKPDPAHLHMFVTKPIGWLRGVNAEGKESEYTYNGLGYLIRLEQGLKNPNNLFINNHNTGGNRYIGLLEDEANEGITIPEGQQTYEDNYGLTRQRE
ncbi:MAG: hypothetical protein LBL58_17090 [Tannerellaceae bacterium]|jgi:hypothetical protein|nr:hypothetical protein [Tannerellaceae bacterium]